MTVYLRSVRSVTIRVLLLLEGNYISVISLRSILLVEDGKNGSRFMMLLCFCNDLHQSYLVQSCIENTWKVNNQ